MISYDLSSGFSFVLCNSMSPLRLLHTSSAALHTCVLGPYYLHTSLAPRPFMLITAPYTLMIPFLLRGKPSARVSSSLRSIQPVKTLRLFGKSLYVVHPLCLHPTLCRPGILSISFFVSALSKCLSYTSATVSW